MSGVVFLYRLIVKAEDLENIALQKQYLFL